jgi:acetylglutamate/LysW-gamma-L-alpha-aminoadipate kinase
VYVIKVGGALGTTFSGVCNDIHALTSHGETVVVVHGGSAEANALGQQLGHPPRYLTTPSGMRSRYTDAATLDVLTLAMVGRVKPLLVAQLARLGVRAIGLTGIDGALITAEKTPPVRAILDERLRVVRDDLTGRIASINSELLDLLINAGYVPVVSPPVIDLNSGPLNIDADRLAAAIAVALRADQLLVLSDVPGLLRDIADPASLVRSIPAGEIEQYMELARGRMRVKLHAARDAIRGGVARVVLGDGRGSSPILAALGGAGTTLAASPCAEGVPS